MLPERNVESQEQRNAKIIPFTVAPCKGLHHIRQALYMLHCCHVLVVFHPELHATNRSWRSGKQKFSVLDLRLTRNEPAPLVDEHVNYERDGKKQKQTPAQ